MNFAGYGSGPHSIIGGGPGGPEKYYGNGTVAVWSFVTGSLQVIQFNGYFLNLAFLHNLICLKVNTDLVFCFTTFHN